MSKNKVGLLGGTFDPIHVGHLHLAFEILESFDLDEILFVPAFTSPFKIHDTVASAKDRLEMVRLAIKGIEKFSLLDFEIKQEKVSYTVDTLEFLKKSQPKNCYYLILGEDVFKNFFTWKRANDILEMSDLIVGSREGVLKKEGTNIPKQHQERVEKGFCKIHNLEISSTYVKERLQNGLYTAHLILPKVLDYIHQNGLYCLPK